MASKIFVLYSHIYCSDWFSVEGIQIQNHSLVNTLLCKVSSQPMDWIAHYVFFISPHFDLHKSISSDWMWFDSFIYFVKSLVFIPFHWFIPIKTIVIALWAVIHIRINTKINKQKRAFERVFSDCSNAKGMVIHKRVWQAYFNANC